MLRVRNGLAVPERELEERFVRASGPGGQNVNKLATAVELRFDLARSPTLHASIRARAMRLAGSRLTKDGVLVIRAERFRTQERNRADARDRLIALLRRASVPVKARVPTRPPRAARERQRKLKTARAAIKRSRRERPALD